METKLREVKIEEYWSLIVKNTAEFGQIAVAENPEFNNLAECIYRVLCDSFIDADMTEYGVSRWEKMLGITPAEGSSLDDRKAAILTQLSVKIPYTVRVLRQMLIGILGEDNFTMKLNNDTATLTVAVSLDTTEAQIAEVESLLDRVLPHNLVTEIDEMPIGYSRLEWIENTNKAIIDSELRLNSEYEIFGDIDYTNWNTGQNCLIGTGTEDNLPQYSIILVNHNSIRFDYNKTIKNEYIGTQEAAGKKWLITTKKNVLELQIPELNKTKRLVHEEETFNVDRTAYIFALNKIGSFRLNAKLFALCGSVNGESMFDFIPAFDKTTGGPCLFDKVRRQIFYSINEDDFNYPGKEEEPTTYSLRRPTMYAQYTEHGIRRLYRTPEGYNGTKEEYAMEHGFKPLIETPKPEEGYWIPEWRETETQLILEWVETEAPIEVIEND